LREKSAENGENGAKMAIFDAKSPQKTPKTPLNAVFSAETPEKRTKTVENGAKFAFSAEKALEIADFSGVFPAKNANFAAKIAFSRAQNCAEIADFRAKMGVFGAKTAIFGAKKRDFGGKMDDFGEKMDDFGEKMPKNGAKVAKNAKNAPETADFGDFCPFFCAKTALFVDHFVENSAPNAENPPKIAEKLLEKWSKMAENADFSPKNAEKRPFLRDFSAIFAENAPNSTPFFPNPALEISAENGIDAAEFLKKWAERRHFSVQNASFEAKNGSFEAKNGRKTAKNGKNGSKMAENGPKTAENGSKSGKIDEIVLFFDATTEKSDFSAYCAAVLESISAFSGKKTDFTAEICSFVGVF
jgi:hypothetical protein